MLNDLAGSIALLSDYFKLIQFFMNL
jgi:hypothetical protein